MGHYSFLRNVWKRSTVAVDSDDKIEKLNKSVALVKGHIMTLSRKEQSQNANTQNALTKDFILNSPEYLDLKIKYDKLLEQKEDFLQNTTSGGLMRKISNKSAG